MNYGNQSSHRSPPTSFFVIAGPCVIESLELCLEVGRHVKGVCDRLASATSSRHRSTKQTDPATHPSAPGLEEGIRILERIKAELGVPVLTDVHESSQPRKWPGVIDILQVPAFLARHGPPTSLRRHRPSGEHQKGTIHVPSGNGAGSGKSALRPPNLKSQISISNLRSQISNLQSQISI